MVLWSTIKRRKQCLIALKISDSISVLASSQTSNSLRTVLWKPHSEPHWSHPQTGVGTKDAKEARSLEYHVGKPTVPQWPPVNGPMAKGTLSALQAPALLPLTEPKASDNITEALQRPTSSNSASTKKEAQLHLRAIRSVVSLPCNLLKIQVLSNKGWVCNTFGRLGMNKGSWHHETGVDTLWISDFEEPRRPSAWSKSYLNQLCLKQEQSNGEDSPTVQRKWDRGIEIVENQNLCRVVSMLHVAQGHTEAPAGKPTLPRTLYPTSP